MTKITDPCLQQNTEANEQWRKQQREIDRDNNPWHMPWYLWLAVAVLIAALAIFGPAMWGMTIP